VTRIITPKIKQKPTTIKQSPQPIRQKPTTNKDPRTINQGQERVNKVALLIPSSHMVNLLLYHHCIWDFIPLVVMSFFKEGHVPSSFTPRSETKDQPMPQA
jgi:hypothetical protein